MHQSHLFDWLRLSIFLKYICVSVSQLKPRHLYLFRDKRRHLSPKPRGTDARLFLTSTTWDLKNRDWKKERNRALSYGTVSLTTPPPPPPPSSQLTPLNHPNPSTTRPLTDDDPSIINVRRQTFLKEKLMSCHFYWWLPLYLENFIPNQQALTALFEKVVLYNFCSILRKRNTTRLTLYKLK